MSERDNKVVSAYNSKSAKVTVDTRQEGQRTQITKALLIIETIGR